MKKIIVLFCSLIFSFASHAQTLDEKQYNILIKKADSLYLAKDYKKAAQIHSSAFKTLGWAAYPNDRYNAACCWALANMPDSAFFQLNYLIGTPDYFNDYALLIDDLDFNLLHNDKRWQSILKQIEIIEKKINKPVKKTLDSVLIEDQKYRMMLDSVQRYRSQEDIAMWNTIHIKDSSNLLIVKKIIAQYGWLGADEVGQSGNSALFLVIQHSDLKTQEEYLPLLKEAVKTGKAEGSSLALLVDRIEMQNGKKQIYGSQITETPDEGFTIFPIEDEKNVDKRRAEVGLGKLEDYVKRWGIIYHLPEN